MALSPKDKIQALLDKALHDRDAAPRESHSFIRTAYAVRIAALKAALAAFEESSK